MKRRRLRSGDSLRGLASRYAVPAIVERLELRRLPAQVGFQTQPQTTAVGESLNPIEIALPSGSPDGLVSLALRVNPGSMQLAGTTTATSINGVATFSNLYLHGGDAAQGFVLTAYAPGFDPADSMPFSVKSGSTHLNLLNIPAQGTAGTNLSSAQQPITVNLLDDNGTISRGVDGVQVILDLQNAPAGARFVDAGGSPITGPLTATAQSGVATFPDVRLNIASGGYRLEASVQSSLIRSASSSNLMITPAASSGLAFAESVPIVTVNQPIIMFGYYTTFAQPCVTVRAVDAFGNLAPDFTGQVTVSLRSNPSGGVLGGLTTVAAVQGVARFDSLTIAQTGVGYVLGASASGLSNAPSSNPFDVVASGSSSLAIVPPTVTTVGINQKLPPIVVNVLDQNGRLLVSDNSTRVYLQPSGVLFGVTSATVVNGVATFDQVYMGRRTLTDAPSRKLNVMAGFLDLAIGPSAPVALTLTAGAPHALQFVNTAIDNVTAGDALTSGGKSIQVSVVDISNNVVDIDGLTVTLGVNQAGANPLPTMLGNGSDPTNPANLGLYQSTTTTNGIATFDQLFINRASTGYQLAGGTTDFYNFKVTTSDPFHVTIGDPDQLRFLWEPVDQVGSRMQIPGKGNVLTVAVTDRVGNVVVSEQDTLIMMELVVPAGAPGTPTLKTGQSGGLSKQVINGTAQFDALYVDQITPSPPAPPVIDGYMLRANAPSLPTSTELSTPFAVAPPPSVAPPDTLAFATPPPASIGVNQPFSVTVSVSNSQDPGIFYGLIANVTLILVDPTTKLPTVGFGLIGVNSGVIPDSSNRLTLSNLQLDRPGTFLIRASTDIGALVEFSGELVVTAGGVSASFATPTAAPPIVPLNNVDVNPHALDVGLGSITQNLNYYQSFPVYPTLPANSAPSGIGDPPPLVQPNVTPRNPADPSGLFFDQVPISTKWWTSQMFPRVQAQGIDQRDSRENRLWSMHADPFSMMVNSSTGNPDDFAGLDSRGSTTSSSIRPPSISTRAFPGRSRPSRIRSIPVRIASSTHMPAFSNPTNDSIRISRSILKGSPRMQRFSLIPIGR